LALCVYSHNWWYGQPLPRRGTDCVQLIHGIVLIGIPVLFWITGYGLLTGFDPAYPDPAALIWLSYLILCCVVCLIILPLITGYRLLKKSPKELIRDHANLVDVASEVGSSLLGDTHLRFLAKLPGNQVFKVDFSERTLQLPRLP